MPAKRNPVHMFLIHLQLSSYAQEELSGVQKSFRVFFQLLLIRHWKLMVSFWTMPELSTGNKVEHPKSLGGTQVPVCLETKMDSTG